MPATIGAGKVHTASRASAAFRIVGHRVVDGDDERMRLARRQQLGLHVPRADRGDRHAGAVQIDAQALAQRDEPGLRRRIGAEARQPAKAGDAGDGDDASVAALDHAGHGAADGRRRADEVGLEDRLDARPVELLARRDAARSRRWRRRSRAAAARRRRAPRRRSHRRRRRRARAPRRVRRQRRSRAPARRAARVAAPPPTTCAPRRGERERQAASNPRRRAGDQRVANGRAVHGATVPAKCATARPMPQHTAVPTSPAIMVSSPARSSGRCVSRALATPTP